MAGRWRELHGSGHWEGLLDPLDADLRRCLITYGEMITATYEAFIGESRSPNAGMCAARRRDIVVAWRGTQRALEWGADLKLALASAAGILGPEGADGSDPSVHRGYLSLYTSADEGSKLNKQSARMQVLTEIARLMDKYKDEDTSITVVGHSLGAALATLNAVDIVANAYNKSPGFDVDSRRAAPVTAVVFGSPRTGDRDFRDIFHRLPDLRMLRVRNKPDRIPHYPPVGYADVGVKLLIDTRRSPFLKPHGNESQSHDLEVHLHGVAGWRGGSGEFGLVVERDVALVNKFDDCLADEYPVPVGWKVHHNKSMVKGPDGRWVLEDHEPDCDDEEEDDNNINL
nr:unnamed protein product [Digitaria exilis]